jgi:hypothetical protein
LDISIVVALSGGGDDNPWWSHMEPFFKKKKSFRIHLTPEQGQSQIEFVQATKASDRVAHREDGTVVEKCINQTSDRGIVLLVLVEEEKGRAALYVRP